MQNFQGIGVSPGQVVGLLRHMPPALSEPSKDEKLPPGTSVEDAAADLRSASASVQKELQERATSAPDDAKSVLEATALMAADPMLIKAAIKLINGGISPQRAVWEAADSVAAMLMSLGGYMAERAIDVLDVRCRIVAALRGEPAPGVPISSSPFILVADDLAPADTATLDPARVIALVTAGGGPQSHTAIIARSLGLPAVVAATGVSSLADLTEIYVDGSAGIIRPNPGNPEQSTAAAWASRASTLGTYSGHACTKDGHGVPLLANVGGAAEAVQAAAAGAEGVGLLRTEFCFLGQKQEPTMHQQVEAYRGVFTAFAGKKVVVRTLDSGADKPLPYVSESSEPNPALGVRGYRTDFAYPGVLERQLAAIAEAARGTTADVWVMAPMIAVPEEAARFAAQCAVAGLRTPGVMVEIPSAAVTASAILAEVEFLSLGTNDLTQYTMAADRQLGPLAALNSPWQPAVLTLISLTVSGSLDEGNSKPVGVCGEAAADPALAVVLVGLGVKSLSMTARSLAAVAAVLASVTLAEAQKIAAMTLQATGPTQAREIARQHLPILLELGL